MNGRKMNCNSGRCNNIIRNWYVWGSKGRGQIELERERRRKGFVLYSEAYWRTEGIFLQGVV